MTLLLRHHNVMPKLTHIVKKEQETPYEGTCCHEYDPKKES